MKARAIDLISRVSLIEIIADVLEISPSEPFAQDPGTAPRRRTKRKVGGTSTKRILLYTCGNPPNTD